MTTLYRKDLGAPKDFTESRSIVCMIDRVCCVMYRCNYELLISPYNLFHPTTKNTLQPGRLLTFPSAETPVEMTRNGYATGINCTHVLNEDMPIKD